MSVTVILEEAGSLGHLEVAENMLAVGRGFGLRLIFVYQGVPQLARNWKADGGRTLLANTSQVYFATNEYETAEHISKRIGMATEVLEEGGNNRSYSSQSSYSANQNTTTHSTGRSQSFRYHGREVVKPDEILRLPPWLAITFAGGGMPPVLTRLVRYYQEPAWLWRQPGWLGRIHDAFRTLLLSTVHFAVAAACAAVLTVMVLPDPSYESEALDGGTATGFSEPAVRRGQGELKQRAGANRQGTGAHGPARRP